MADPEKERNRGRQSVGRVVWAGMRFWGITSVLSWLAPSRNVLHCAGNSKRPRQIAKLAHRDLIGDLIEGSLKSHGVVIPSKAEAQWTEDERRIGGVQDKGRIMCWSGAEDALT